MPALVSDWLQDQATQVVLLVATLAAFGKFGHMAYRFLKQGIEVAEFVQHELRENSGRSLHDYTVRNDRRFEWLIDQMGLTLPDELKSPDPKEGTTP